MTSPSVGGVTQSAGRATVSCIGGEDLDICCNQDKAINRLKVMTAQKPLGLAPLIPVSSISVANALYKNRCVRVDFPGPLDSISLCWLMTADSFSTWPANRIITIFWSLLNKQFTAHKVLLSLTDKNFTST